MSNQILHIFRKDVRHHWPEIVLSLAAVVTYAWRQSAHLAAWNQVAPGDTPLSQLASVLVTVAWVLLIVRVVQGENLVGDRQFWVTRPYEWKKLLVAKLLFVLVFVNVPLFILQSFVLMAAGFPLSSHIAGLLWLQLLWVIFVILPVLTLATVTAGIGQFVLTVLGLVLCIIFAAALFGKVNAPGVSVVESLPSEIGGLILLAASVAVVLWQFARRRAAQSRTLLLGAASVFPLIAIVTPYTALIAHKYPMATPGQRLSVQLAFDPATLTSHEGGFPEKDKVHVLIPLLVSGVDDGSMVEVGGVMESIQANGGAQWNSGWHGSSMRFLANHQHANLVITLKRDFFERVKSTPVNLHLTFAMAPMQARKTERLVTRDDVFPVAGEGRCMFSPFDPDVILCSFLFKTPLLLARAKSDEITCPVRRNEIPLPSGMILYSSLGEGGGLALNPIRTNIFYHWDLDRDVDDVKARDYRSRVCPGTPLTLFSNWEDLPRYRTELKIDGIRLADYQLNDARDGMGGFGITVP
jgi:hypothetical protein